MTRLEDTLFSTIVKNTPLISIDIIIKNPAGMYLLGERLNRPAKNFWFVPGGRIFKNEKIASAFVRIAKDEVNIDALFPSALFLGSYEHFYNDNFSSADFSTHYVVLAYLIEHDVDLSKVPKQQHSNYNFFSEEDILSSKTIHEYTKDYFKMGRLKC